MYLRAIRFYHQAMKPPPSPLGGMGVKINEEQMEKLLNPIGFLNDQEQKEVQEAINNAKELKALMEKHKLKQEKQPEIIQKTNDGQKPTLPPEVGFKVKGLEPTRYGDWIGRDIQMQDYCENCAKIYEYQDEIKVLSQRLELTQAQVKVLKNENEILRKSISKNHKRTNNQPNKASKTLELEIEKLKEIIRQKDEIIKEQVPFDNFSETSSVTQQNLLFLKQELIKKCH